MKIKNPMLILKAGLAGAQVISGGLGVLNIASDKVVGLIVLVIAGAQAAVTFFEHGASQGTAALLPVQPIVLPPSTAYAGAADLAPAPAITGS